MSTFLEYMEEKQIIDNYLNDGYKIKYIDEHIEGDTVTWVKRSTDIEDNRTLLIKTADARKYLGDVLINQLILGLE